MHSFMTGEGKLDDSSANVNSVQLKSSERLQVPTQS